MNKDNFYKEKLELIKPFFHDENGDENENEDFDDLLEQLDNYNENQNQNEEFSIDNLYCIFKEIKKL